MNDLDKIKLDVLANVCEVYDLAVSDYIYSNYIVHESSKDYYENLASDMRDEIVKYLKSTL
jgi:hypothetical protein